MKQQYPNEFVINLKDDVETVAKQISSCEKIISSSLHGLIAAQAYDIPFAWVKFSDNIKGDGIKFYDFFDSVGVDLQLSTVENPKFLLGKYDKENIITIIESLPK